MDGDRHCFDWMIFTSNIRKIRGSLSDDNIRLALSQWNTPNHMKVMCQHVMFTTHEKCQPLRKFAEGGDPWADFLSWQKLLAALLLEKKEIMQGLVANILLIISIVKLS